MATWGGWNFSVELQIVTIIYISFFHFCPLSAVCAVSPRSGPSLGPSMPLVPRLTVYCNPADSFLQPHFYEFSISPLYRVSRPFIKQYVVAVFPYFRVYDRGIRTTASSECLLVSSWVKLPWGTLGWAK